MVIKTTKEETSNTRDGVIIAERIKNELSQNAVFNKTLRILTEQTTLLQKNFVDQQEELHEHNYLMAKNVFFEHFKKNPPAANTVLSLAKTVLDWVSTNSINELLARAYSMSVRENGCFSKQDFYSRFTEEFVIIMTTAGFPLSLLIVDSIEELILYQKTIKQAISSLPTTNHANKASTLNDKLIKQLINKAKTDETIKKELIEFFLKNYQENTLEALLKEKLSGSKLKKDLLDSGITMTIKDEAFLSRIQQRRIKGLFGFCLNLTKELGGEKANFFQKEKHLVIRELLTTEQKEAITELFTTGFDSFIMEFKSVMNSYRKKQSAHYNEHTEFRLFCNTITVMIDNYQQHNVKGLSVTKQRILALLFGLYPDSLIVKNTTENSTEKLLISDKSSLIKGLETVLTELTLIVESEHFERLIKYTGSYTQLKNNHKDFGWAFLKKTRVVIDSIIINNHCLREFCQGAFKNKRLEELLIILEQKTELLVELTQEFKGHVGSEKSIKKTTGPSQGDSPLERVLYNFSLLFD